ncbi:hypothetical protein EZY14_009125 [Kordia sp. TARA_039_SRF]|nr:hypothetical protein EZY14_009125 [Kordia sp. TARA_039_SRF]
MQVKITGTNAIDADKRLSAIEKLNKLPTEVLKNISTLCDNEKAVDYLKDESSVGIITSFLG